MIDLVRRTLSERCGVVRGDRIVVALSGGRDSVVLTHLMRRLAPEFGLTLSCVHIHHGLRVASDGEERFVRSLCEQWGLGLEVFRLDLTLGVGQSPETAARDARYSIFETKCAEGNLVATAHHLDDCMETFLINLCRGSGCEGLSSIPFRRERIIRPMLSVSAEQVERYALANGLTWVEDESNADTRYLRNFMRREIIPKLKERTDLSFTAGFAATVENLRRENEALDIQAKDIDVCNKCGRLAEVPAALCWRYLKKLCPVLTRERFERVYGRLQDGETRFAEQISGETYLCCRDGQMYVETRVQTPPLVEMPLAKKLLLSDGRTLCLEEIHKPFTHSDIDCATIGLSAVVRSRKAGDEIRLHARPTKTLKKLFNEAGVEQRENKVVIADENGIVWVEGFGAAERCAPDRNTQSAFRVIIK